MGIDPGKSGSATVIARIGGSETVDVMRFEKATEKEINTFLFNHSFLCHMCYIEKVASRPKQGVRSVFTFGENTGFIRGLLVANEIPFTFVLPKKWQNKLGLGKKQASYTARKRMHKQRAEELFPSIRITNDMADSMLLAEYGKQVYAG